MNKLIGTVSSYFTNADGIDKLNLNLAYVDYFSKFGDVVIIPADHDRIYDLDLLVVPGGADVDPLRYNAKPNRLTQKPDLYMEYFDTQTLPSYISKGVPVFGICRGFQSLNCLFGGTLTQHMNVDYSTKSRGHKVDILAFHEANAVKHFGQSFYTATTRIGKSEKVKGKRLPYMVNSLHHQGYYEDQMSKEFDLIAINQKYGNVEIAVHKTLPIYMIQHHAEELENNSFDDLMVQKLLNFK